MSKVVALKPHNAFGTQFVRIETGGMPINLHLPLAQKFVAGDVGIPDEVLKGTIYGPSEVAPGCSQYLIESDGRWISTSNVELQELRDGTLEIVRDYDCVAATKADMIEAIKETLGE